MLLGRRVGQERLVELARGDSLTAALRLLLGTSYGERLHEADSLAEAERSLAATTLWHLRILAGWLPPSAAEPMRALTGWFEIANIEDKVAALATDFIPPPPFELGGLATAWRRVDEARDLGEVRSALAASAWDDPEVETPAGMLIALRVSWARRLAAQLPEARVWIEGASALLLARELLQGGGEGRAKLLRRLPGVSADALGARSIQELTTRLPDSASWTLAPARAAEELWRAELAWWARVERDAEQLRRRGSSGRAKVLAATALLSVDARNVARALAESAGGLNPDEREAAGASG